MEEEEPVVLNKGADINMQPMADLSVASAYSFDVADVADSSASKPAWSEWTDAVESVTHCAALLTDVVQQFWDLPVRVSFFSLSDQPHYYWRWDDFHVSQFTIPAPRVEKQNPYSQEEALETDTLDVTASGEPAQALLRLSETACSLLLSRVLGVVPGKAFDFKTLSPLEASVLNDFSRDVLACLNKELLRKSKTPFSGAMLHSVWVIQPAEEPSGSAMAPSPPSPAKDTRFQASLKDAGNSAGLDSGSPEVVGKIIFSIPAEVLRLTPLPLAEQERVPDSFFYHVEAEASFYIGQSRMALSDVNQLEVDDVVVLEQSDIQQLFLLEPVSGERLPFPVYLTNPESMSIPYTQELAMMDTQAQNSSVRQNLWDNLMIDVSAEFEPVKLPLKQLKQMSEGLVVEMGDLLHNRICLQVEGKTLAWGELVIVGDKFGVRVSQVEPEPGANESESASYAGGLTAPDSASAEWANEADGDAGDEQAFSSEDAPLDEEANLDNFLNDDFDNTFDEQDDEDW